MEFLQPLISIGPDSKNIVDVAAPHLIGFQGEVSRAHVSKSSMKMFA